MHDPYRWVVADEAERLAIAPLISDVLKWAHQLSDDTIWELKNFAPITWRQVSAVSSVHGRTGAVTAQAGDYTPAQVGADPAGAASNAVTSHEQAADPHSQYAQKADLAAVANSGDYNDLTNKPDLSVLEEVTVYADLASFPASGETDKVYIAQDTGYMYRWSGSGYVQLTDQTAIWGQISGNLANQADLSNALAAKVDKVAGKGLSTNDYTDAEQSKLSGIEPGATKNATDAQLRDRSTHTGTQPASTISDFNSQASAAAPVQSVDGRAGAVDLSGSYEAKRQNNLSAATDPTAADDASAGYEPMSRWINTSTGEIWLCVDATNGAANWQKASLTLDELGSAAVVDVGTGQAQIPLNSDLGSAAYSDASEFDEAGAASSAVSSHQSASNPHPQYTTDAEVNDLAPKAPGVLDGLRRSVESASGGRMTVFYTALGQPSYFVRQPQFLCEDIAPGGELGSGVHEAFRFGAETDAEIWVGAYPGSVVNGEGVSQPGVETGRSIDFDQARAACQACGSGFDLMTTWDWSAVALWCMANGFEPRGNTNHGRHHDNRWETGTRQDGDTYIPGDNSGIGNILTGSGPVQWRHDGTMSGISDLVGNVWEWSLGFKMIDGRIFLSPDNDIPAESSYTDTGWDMPGNQTWASMTATGASDALKRALIVPKGVDDPTGNLYTNLSGERLPLRGGPRSNGGAAGLGALYLSSVRTHSYTSIGFRPRFRNP
ncbi:hypothetical protein MLC59_02095 [Marinobacter bryozoorum]|uniref:hypothetical protein n=1 Tax=Marinobacter bryozoorum TaxID=256324 RepID=UPI002005DB1D|nr:hypothetical protein [Marinobacter bryozoorum]MCK7542961.1 hypothetical protein [Marinobacter bryozoorum]